MYKDKALQKETTRDRVRRYRDKALQGVTLDEGVTQGVTEALQSKSSGIKKVVNSNVQPGQDKVLHPELPERWRPYSKEDQLSMKSKKQVKKELKFSQLKKQYGVKFT